MRVIYYVIMPCYKDEFVQGSVSGILEVLNIHGDNYRFSIYPIAGPKRIECQFSEKLLSDAIAGIGKYVSVTGRVKYHSRSPFPFAVEVESMEIFPDEDQLPSFLDIQGMAPKAIGKLTSEEFIRRIRDAE